MNVNVAVEVCSTSVQCVDWLKFKQASPKILHSKRYHYTNLPDLYKYSLSHDASHLQIYKPTCKDKAVII